MPSSGARDCSPAPQPSVSEASLHPADRHPQNTGVRSPTPHSLRARRHRNSNAARERPLRSSLLVGRNGEFACLYGSIVSHSATSICEQRNPFQSPCDPLLTVPVLRSYLPNGLQSVGNSMPSASYGPLQATGPFVNLKKNHNSSDRSYSMEIKIKKSTFYTSQDPSFKVYIN